MATARSGNARRGAKSSDDGAGWLTTYGDLVTLLMAFFVLLYAMSEVDIAKFNAFITGLAVPFGNDAGEGIMPEHEGLTPEPAPDVVPPVELTPDVSEMLERAAAAEASLAQLDEVEAALDAALAEAGLSDYVEQRREERGLIVSVASDDVLFALGSTDISPIGERVIETVTVTLGEFHNDVLVEGHTDDIPLRRGSYTNWNLSTDRAVAVLSRMVGEHRFSTDRIGAVGYGEFRPLVDNETRANRSRNRRVDFVVLRDDAPTEAPV
jgi:chemotaxis protein MotB